MSLPFEYDRVALGEFGGTTPTTTDFERARVVILPVPGQEAFPAPVPEPEAEPLPPPELPPDTRGNTRD